MRKSSFYFFFILIGIRFASVRSKVTAVLNIPFVRTTDLSGSTSTPLLRPPLSTMSARRITLEYLVNKKEKKRNALGLDFG